MLLEEFDPTKKAVIDPEKTVDKIKDFPPITMSVVENILTACLRSFLIAVFLKSPQLFSLFA